MSKVLLRLNLRDSNAKCLILITLSMLYVTSKLTCNPLFFRQVEVLLPIVSYSYKLNASAFSFPLIYIISDMIAALTNRKLVIVVIIIGMICDGLSSYFAMIISAGYNGSDASILSLNRENAIVTFGVLMWDLFYYGFWGTCVASICEVILFYFFFRRLNSFFFATVLSIVTILAVHNLITDYYTMFHDPDKLLVIFRNTITEITIVLFYMLLTTMFIKVFKIRHVFNRI